MHLAFEKWHGCKNDFVIIWMNARDQVLLNSVTQRAKEICSRQGDGVGADGVIILLTESEQSPTPEKIKIINSDGSLAQTCGNGIRCAALSTLKRYLPKARGTDVLEGVAFDVEGTEVFCEFLGLKKNPQAQELPWVAVRMGHTLVNENLAWFSAAQANVRMVLAKHNLTQLEKTWAACELSNRHLVFFLQEKPKFPWREIAQTLQKSADWDGINVHFAYPLVQTKDSQSKAIKFLQTNVEDGYEALVWERGVGPTQACGSGACAIAACAMTLEEVSRESWLQIEMPGGSVFVQQKEEDDLITLAGPGQFVYSGFLDF